MLERVVEVKLRIPGGALESVRRTLKERCRLVQTVTQKDVLYQVPQGLLKLRQSQPGQKELIWYERPDVAGLKLAVSKRFYTDQPDQLHAVLEAALPIKASLTKERCFYDFEGVEIHLDNVPGLGFFLEVEIRLEADAPEPPAQARITEAQRTLGFVGFPVERATYSAMLEAKRNADQRSAS
ncbi:MAG: class IV adenylate cyclase [Pseudomonadota bacterium]